jgi:hypothetical protein
VLLLLANLDTGPGADRADALHGKADLLPKSTTALTKARAAGQRGAGQRAGRGTGVCAYGPPGLLAVVSWLLKCCFSGSIPFPFSKPGASPARKPRLLVIRRGVTRVAPP